MKTSGRHAIVVLTAVILASTAQAYQANAPGTPTASAHDLQVEVSVEDRTSGISNESVEFSSGDGTVNFNGSIQAPTPCHTINTRTSSSTENTTVIDIRLDKTNETQICTQQLVQLSYSGSASGVAERLRIQHEGRNMGLFKGIGDKQQSIISELLSMLTKVFA